MYDEGAGRMTSPPRFCGSLFLSLIMLSHSLLKLAVHVLAGILALQTCSPHPTFLLPQRDPVDKINKHPGLEQGSSKKHKDRSPPCELDRRWPLFSKWLVVDSLICPLLWTGGKMGVAEVVVGGVMTAVALLMAGLHPFF